MSQGYQPAASTVLVLEADPSLRRLITLGLWHRQFRVIEAVSLATLSPAEIQELDLLILDIDKGLTSEWPSLEMAQRYPQLTSLPKVILSWEPSAKVAASDAVFLCKPFDARALHEKIDELLAVRANERMAEIAQAEAVLLAAYDQHITPSIWPIITAAGLLLAVIGLLLQFALVIVGILVIVASLLLWTLGSQTQTTLNDVALGVGKS
jgi:CheY-like chemotaxis protein